MSFLPLSFLMRELILEARFRGAAQFGKLRRQGQLCRQILGERYRDRQRPPSSRRRSRIDGERLRCPSAAFFGTSSRSSSDTLELVAGIAAATGCPPPIKVAVQPDGTPETDKLKPLGRQVIIVQPQIDRGRLARPQRDRRIVAHQIQAFDVLGRAVVGLGNRRDSEPRRAAGQRQERR